jgi:putative membrane protein
MRRIVVIVATTLVTLLAATVVIAGFADRASAPSSIPVALVNLDEPVTTGEGEDETTIAAGRQLAAEITENDEDSPLAWTLVDGDALESSDVHYYAIVTVPADFSASISALADGEVVDAEVSIDTDDPASPIAARIAASVATAATAAFNDDVTSAYLDNVYVSYNTINDAVSDSADGAAQLQSSAAQLADGTASLASGADDLNAGAQSAASAADSLSAGAIDLESGASDLAAGASSLDAALTSGASAAASSLSPYAATSAGQSAALAATLGALAQSCPPTAGTAYCAAIGAAAANAVDAARAAAATQAASDEVVAGLSSAASSATALAAGAASVASGASGVSSGAAGLEDGVDSVAAGAESVATAADDVAAGSASLVDGAESLTAGLTELENAVPAYPDEQQRGDLADAVASPAHSEVNGVEVGGVMGFLALAVAVALWLGGSVLFLRHRAVPAWALAAGASAPRAVLLGLGPRLGIAAVCGVALWLVLLVAGVAGAAAGLSLVLILVAALSSVAILQAIFAIAGRAGHLVVVLFLLLQVAAAGVLAPIEAAPAAVQSIAPALPVSALLRTLQDVIYTGSGPIGSTLVVLVVWGIVAAALSVIATHTGRTGRRVLLAV